MFAIAATGSSGILFSIRFYLPEANFTNRAEIHPVFTGGRSLTKSE